MQREARGRTCDEVRSGRSEPQFGLAGRNDADGVAYARGNLAVDWEGLAQRRSVAGRGCNALTRTAEFFERCASVNGTIQSRHSRRSVPINLSHSELAFRLRHRRLYDFKAETAYRRIEPGEKDCVAVVDRKLRASNRSRSANRFSQHGQEFMMHQCPSFSICSFTFAAIFSVASQATNFYGAQCGRELSRRCQIGRPLTAKPLP
jgi:hypothetical protein